MASRQVSFANSDLGFGSSSVGSQQVCGPKSGTSTSLIYHLGGLCIRDYQLALQQSINELKSREQQVNHLYSSLLDRDETITRLKRENESLKTEISSLKQRVEQMSPANGPLPSGVSLARRGTLILTHELAGELHQTASAAARTPLPLIHSVHLNNGDSATALLSKSRQDKLREALAKNDLLGRLDSEQADGLISHMTEQRVLTGNVIIKEGEPGTRMYVMEDGEVDIHREGQFLCRLLAPMVFGELAVIYNAPRSATVTAATQCRLWQIESKTFHKCMTRVRQRTIGKIATELKNISVFSSLAKSVLCSIVDAGEELHFRQGSHVSIAAGTLYVVTEGSLVLQSIECSCGNNDGHCFEPALPTCHRPMIEIKATACFCSQLPKIVTSALLAATPTSDMSDVFCLTPDEIGTLKASGDSLNRITCYRLDTNFLVRALDKQSREQQSNLLGVEQGQRSLSTTSTGDVSADSSLQVFQSARNSTEVSPGISNLSIIALLPSRDSFSRVFCVVDTRNNLRRNAVTVDEGEETSSPSDDHSSRLSAGSRRSGCYIMRWILRQKADAAGMGERFNNERQHLLGCSSCDFVVQLVSTIQDGFSVYFVYETCLGGTLESLLKANPVTNNSTAGIIATMRKGGRNPQGGGGQGGRAGGIDEDLARFYLACVVEALDFLHSNGIVHRNVCPASIWITSNGYGKLGDFTWTKSIGARSRTFSLCGPVERLAPEVMLNKGHGLAADRWSVGTLLYEIIVGKQPFLRDDPMLTCSAILQYAGSAPGSASSSSDTSEALEFPRRVSKQARDAVRRLCRPCPADRIAFDDLRQHAFFTMHNNVFDWQALRTLQMTPPFVPNVSSSFDVSNILGARKLVGMVPVSGLLNNNTISNIGSVSADSLSTAADDTPSSDQLQQQKQQQQAALALFAGFEAQLQDFDRQETQNR